MDLFDEKIDELLAKHLAGETSSEEESTLQQWLGEAPENRQYMSDLQWLWEQSPEGRPAPSRDVDTEAALSRVKRRMMTGGGGLTWHRGFWMRAAAVFLAVAAATYWWQTNRQSEPMQIAALQAPMTDTLTDGSVVTLQQNSGLTIASGFNRKERRLRLQGEAFFDVAPDTAKPFVVEVQELQVEVVGTAFTVDHASNPDKIVVTVSEGKVRVSLSDQSLLLTPGEQATCDIPAKTLQRTTPEQGMPVGQNRLFRFDATPLGQVVKELGERYKTTIVLKNKALEDCPLTTRYNNQPLERILALIAESFSLTLEKTQEGYTLDGASCEEE